MFARRLACPALLLLAASAAAAPQAYMVFFTLAEPTPEHRDALVAACHKHLADHEGVSYFSVGVIADGLDRDVNDKPFDVALHLVFENPEAHKTYQTHPRHLAFIEEAKSLWSKVRVFDSDLTPAPSTAPSTGE